MLTDDLQRSNDTCTALSLKLSASEAELTQAVSVIQERDTSIGELHNRIKEQQSAHDDVVAAESAMGSELISVASTLETTKEVALDATEKYKQAEMQAAALQTELEVLQALEKTASSKLQLTTEQVTYKIFQNCNS